jgi:RsmE family RNA methyltransferase
MEITDEMTLPELDHLLGNTTKFLLHPVVLGEAGQTSPKKILAEPLPDSLTVLAGPEGSFTDQEVALALNLGFQPLELGNRILRTETACIAAASLFLTYAG